MNLGNPSMLTDIYTRIGLDFEAQFHRLSALCAKRGLNVGLGDDGQVTLTDCSAAQPEAKRVPGPPSPPRPKGDYPVA